MNARNVVYLVVEGMVAFVIVMGGLTFLATVVVRHVLARSGPIVYQMLVPTALI